MTCLHEALGERVAHFAVGVRRNQHAHRLVEHLLNSSSVSASFTTYILAAHTHAHLDLLGLQIAHNRIQFIKNHLHKHHYTSINKHTRRQQ
jgi:hypothetical protein